MKLLGAILLFSLYYDSSAGIDIWCQQACPYYRRFPAIWNARIDVYGTARTCNIADLRTFCNELYHMIKRSQMPDGPLRNDEKTIIQNMGRYTWRDWCNGRGYMGPNCHMP
ncbi:unnamed protein product [Cylicocyclus nassatus]|uniref:Uncharacterized protein n=1 Tax=Cylicocyclus nassatus TaxID=53992 RepID=A0AA36MFF5_CYLNA|nr:unnamed protein product [Cylicocyclus nassatus]